MPQQFGSEIVFLAVLISVLISYAGARDQNATVEEGRFFLWGKPFLIFPRTSPTRTQFIAGIGIPLETAESVTTGWVLKTQFYLPYNVTQLRPVLFEGWNDTRRSLGKRDVVGEVAEDHYEKYEAEKVKIDSEKLPEDLGDGDNDDDDEFEDGDDNYWLDAEEAEQFQEANQQDPEEAATVGYNAEQSRWIAYRALEKVGERYGAGGRPCVLRSICEAAAAEFTYTGGVFAELLHIVFTPSTTTEALSEHSDNEYYRAEQMGREGAPCERIFHECKRSLLDLFSGVHDPVTNALLPLAHQEILQALLKQAL